MSSEKRGSAAGERARPTGRDDVSAAIIEAAADLFSSTSPAAVSTRAIAATANVNQALIYRHFGDRDGLIRAVLAAEGAAVADDLVDEADLERLLAGVAAHRRYFRILARLVLEDGGYVPADFPIVQRVLGEESDADVRIDTAVTGALLMGWILFEDYVVEATRLDDEEQAIARRRVAEVLAVSSGRDPVEWV